MQNIRSEGFKSPSISQIERTKMSEARKIKSSISKSFSDDSSVADVATVALVSSFIDSLQNDNFYEQGNVLNEAPSWQTTKSSSSSTTMRYKETLAKARNAVATVSMKKKSRKEKQRSVELIISSTESSDGDTPPPPPPPPLTENQEQNHVNMTHSTKSNDIVIPPPSILPTENRKMVHNDTNSFPLATQDGKIEPVGDLESLEPATQYPTHIAQHVSPAITIALNSYAKIKKNTQSYQANAILENGINDASKELQGNKEKHRPCPNLSPSSVLAKARAASAARAARTKSKKTESCDENESWEVKYDESTDINMKCFSKDSSSNLGQSISNTMEATSASKASEQPSRDNLEVDCSIGDCANASTPIPVVLVGGKVTKAYVPIRPGRTPRSKATLEYAKSIISASKRDEMPRRDHIDWRKKVNLTLLDDPLYPKDTPVLDDMTPQPTYASTISTTVKTATVNDDLSNPKSTEKSSDGDTHIRIGSHIIPKDVNFYAVLSQIQKAVSSDNVSNSLGRILVDSNRRGISMEVMTELYKIEMLKVGNPSEESSSNSSIPSTGFSQGNLLEPLQEADIVVESSLSNLTIANEDDDDDHENIVTTIQGHNDTITTKSSDNVADDMQELLHLCDKVKSIFNENSDIIDSNVECSTPKMKNASFSGGPFSFEDESASSAVTIGGQDNQTTQDLNEDENEKTASNSSQSGYEISLPGLSEDQLNQLTHFVSNTEMMLRETNRTPQLCIDDAANQSFEGGSDTKFFCEDMSEHNDNGEEIDAFLSKFHIDEDARPNKSQHQDKRMEVMHDEDDVNEINAEKMPMKGKRKTVAFKALSPTCPRREPLMEISSPKMIDRAKPMDTLFQSPEVHQEVCTAPKAIYFKKETRGQCFLPKKTRLAGHSGYMNIDFYSLYDATLVKAQDEIIDRAPWEYRDVGQRFLDEKSLESRNWFGESMVNYL